MSPASYRAAPPRVGALIVSEHAVFTKSVSALHEFRSAHRAKIEKSQRLVITFYSVQMLQHQLLLLNDPVLFHMLQNRPWLMPPVNLQVLVEHLRVR